MDEPEITIGAGRLRGRRTANGVAYLGVPYAAPPVGARRYRGPQPAEPWEGVRDATLPAPVLPQPVRELPGLDMRPLLGPGWHGEAPELTVNVWTPHDPELPGDPAGRPVMVFLHGGAFVAGTPSTYEGDAFARDGVVLVTVGYRLGIEGFLLLEDGEANVALRDQLAALQWVQDEIAAFGGDPGNVTVFGQSAGAITLDCLLSTPLLRGLAARAISQSGGVRLTFSVEQARRVTAFVAGRLGVEPTHAAFADVPLERIVEVQQELVSGAVDIVTETDDDPASGLALLLPVRDGDLVAHDPLRAIADGGGSGLPLMAGDTAEEGNLYLAGAEAFDPAVARKLSEAVFKGPTRALCEAQRAAGAPLWRYEFGWRSPAFDGRLGACHCLELPFVFDALETPGLVGERGLLGPVGAPPQLAERIHGAWVAFATRGDPGWPQDQVQQLA